MSSTGRGCVVSFTTPKPGSCASSLTYAYDAVSEGVVTWLTRTKEPAGYIQRVITPGFTYRKLRQAATQSSCDDDLEASLRASLAKVGVKDPSGN
jgi:hypothetical protein